MKILILFFLLASCSHEALVEKKEMNFFSSRASVMKNMDRSRVNSELMNFDGYNVRQGFSPHSQLRNFNANQATGCSVCAH